MAAALYTLYPIVNPEMKNNNAIEAINVIALVPW
jgi:hypothetical protein